MRPSLYSASRAVLRLQGGWLIGAALLLVLGTAGPARAQTADSTPTSRAGECCAEMRYPLGGRNIALGQAVVADTAPDMASSNPAGLLGLHHAELLVHYRPVPTGKVIGLTYVTRPYRFGTFAVNYVLMAQ